MIRATERSLMRACRLEPSALVAGLHEGRIGALVARYGADVAAPDVFVRSAVPCPCTQPSPHEFVVFEWLLILFAGLLLGGAIPAAWLAGERGRPPLDWALVGFFLGPVALLMVGLAPIAPAGAWLQCSICLGTVKAGARRCQHCGSSFTQATAPESSEPGDGDEQSDEELGVEALADA